VSWAPLTLPGVRPGTWSIWAISGERRELEGRPVACESSRAEAVSLSDQFALHDPRARSFIVRSPTGLEVHVSHPPGAVLDQAAPSCPRCGDPLPELDADCKRCEAIATLLERADDARVTLRPPPPSVFRRTVLRLIKGGA
jgi:hypothetical protein